MNQKTLIEAMKLLYKRRTDEMVDRLAEEGYTAKEVADAVGLERIDVQRRVTSIRDKANKRKRAKKATVADALK